MTPLSGTPKAAPACSGFSQAVPTRCGLFCAVCVLWGICPRKCWVLCVTFCHSPGCTGMLSLCSDSADNVWAVTCKLHTHTHTHAHASTRIASKHSHIHVFFRTHTHTVSSYLGTGPGGRPLPGYGAGGHHQQALCRWGNLRPDPGEPGFSSQCSAKPCCIPAPHLTSHPLAMK